MLVRQGKNKRTVDDDFEEVAREYDLAGRAKKRDDFVKHRERGHHLAPVVHLKGSGASGDQRKTLRDMAAAVERIDPASLK